MKKTFQNKSLLLATLLLLVPKLFIMLFVTHFLCQWSLFLEAGISFAYAAPFLATLILLAINRRGAAVASIFLVVFCCLDMLVHLVYLLQFPFLPVGLLYDLAVIILLILLHRSKKREPATATDTPMQD